MRLFLRVVGGMLVALWVAFPLLEAEAGCVWKNEVRKTKKVDKACALTTYHGVGTKGSYEMKVTSASIQCGSWKHSWITPLKRSANTLCDSSGGTFDKRSLSRKIKLLRRWKQYVQLEVHVFDYAGGVRPYTLTAHPIYNTKTDQKVRFAEMFPKNHKWLSQQLRLQFENSTWAQKEGKKFSLADFDVVKRNGRKFVRVYCHDSSMALGKQSLELFTPLDPKYNEELWPKNRRARSLRISELFMLDSVFEDQGMSKKHSLKINLTAYPNHYVIVLKKGGKLRLSLVKKYKIVQRLPAFSGNRWRVSSIAAVALRDINKDGKRDVVVMADCMTGMGPQGARPFRVTTTYFQGAGGFFTDQAWEKVLSMQQCKTILEVSRLARRKRRWLRGVNARAQAKASKKCYQRLVRRARVWREWRAFAEIPSKFFRVESKRYRVGRGLKRRFRWFIRTGMEPGTCHLNKYNKPGIIDYTPVSDPSCSPMSGWSLAYWRSRFSIVKLDVMCNTEVETLFLLKKKGRWAPTKRFPRPSRRMKRWMKTMSPYPKGQCDYSMVRYKAEPKRGLLHMIVRAACMDPPRPVRLASYRWKRGAWRAVYALKKKPRIKKPR
ncbi:MAG: hypothetical protein EP343_00050 [Deltaproteobacteria bacterium]|nr:MAG: hypothetical protein EP343_00050 [Deltaproteobacteria bacterium]